VTVQVEDIKWPIELKLCVEWWACQLGWHYCCEANLL